MNCMAKGYDESRWPFSGWLTSAKDSIALSQPSLSPVAIFTRVAVAAPTARVVVLVEPFSRCFFGLSTVSTVVGLLQPLPEFGTVDIFKKYKAYG